MIGASVHVANPCGTFGSRTGWLPDPVEFWRQHHAWENVLKTFYFRNAMRIYPHIKDNLKKLGYPVE
jgi:hypothetical protein